MTVVITGSSGFLGSALVRVFSRNDFKIICLVRHEKIRPGSDNIHFIKYDEKLNENDIITKLAKFSPDVFIHCAWKGVLRSQRNETFQLSYNSLQTIDSVKLAHAAGSRLWIGVGSQAEYGNKLHPIIETEPAFPKSLYGKAKLDAGISAIDLCRKLGIKGIWNRIFSLYGPGENVKYFIPYVINSLLHKVIPALTKCEQQWDYLFVDDAAEAFYAQSVKQSHGIFNLCSGTTVSLKNVVHMIQQLLNDKSLIHFGAIPYDQDQTMILSGNCNKLKDQIGWLPKTTLEEGLKQTINYYQNLESI